MLNGNLARRRTKVANKLGLYGSDITALDVSTTGLVEECYNDAIGVMDEKTQGRQRQRGTSMTAQTVCHGKMRRQNYFASHWA